MILLFALLSGYVGYVFWDSRQSEYKVLEKDNGFVIESERLNETVTREFDLKKGDVIAVTHSSEGGKLWLEIGEEGEEPIFTGHTSAEMEPFTVTVQEVGRYRILCRGRRSKGTLDVTIR